jgi:hypothetical protein
MHQKQGIWRMGELMHGADLCVFNTAITHLEIAAMTPEILDTAGAAEYLSLSCPTLERFRLTGNGPKYAKLTSGPRGPVRYRRIDLDAWLASRLVRSTSDKLSAQ